MVGMDNLKNLANEHSDKINGAVDAAQEQHGDKLGQHADLANKGLDAAQEKFLNKTEQEGEGTPA